jgi:tRNA-specific 2-thiouridylase
MAKIVVGLSGGVDSSVAAYLLKRQGHEVIGLFMHNWEEESGGHCTAEDDYEDVKRVSSRLDIPYYTVNYSKEYYERVFKIFLSEYEKGRTPNPDVLCNREIKFGPFLDFAVKIGADKIATGHYCGILNRGDQTFLTKAADKNKDQSYFLNQLRAEQLSKTLFPLQDLCKDKVREIAAGIGLSNAAKKDSTGICFIGERNFRDFLKGFLPAKEGAIQTVDGKIVGKHSGVMYYTIGQRKGLGIGGMREGDTGRWFVVGKDVQNNILYVEQGSEQKLYSRGLVCEEFNFITQKPEKAQFECTAKTRYRQPDQRVSVLLKEGGGVELRFHEKQRAVTEGQYVVLYDGEVCLGGGCIDKVIF